MESYISNLRSFVHNFNLSTFGQNETSTSLTPSAAFFNLFVKPADWYCMKDLPKFVLNAMHQ